VANFTAFEGLRETLWPRPKREIQQAALSQAASLKRVAERQTRLRGRCCVADEIYKVAWTITTVVYHQFNHLDSKLISLPQEM